MAALRVDGIPGVRDHMRMTLRTQSAPKPPKPERERVPTNLTLPRSLVAEVDAVAGERGRSRFIEDATRYALMFTPLRTCAKAPARVVDGRSWGDTAFIGVARETSFAVAWEGHDCYPFDLADPAVIEWRYVAAHLARGIASSGVSLAFLLRAVAAHLPRERSRA